MNGRKKIRGTALQWGNLKFYFSFYPCTYALSVDNQDMDANKNAENGNMKTNKTQQNILDALANGATLEGPSFGAKSYRVQNSGADPIGSFFFPKLGQKKIKTLIFSRFGLYFWAFWGPSAPIL